MNRRGFLKNLFAGAGTAVAGAALARVPKADTTPEPAASKGDWWANEGLGVPFSELDDGSTWVAFVDDDGAWSVYTNSGRILTSPDGVTWTERK